MTEHEKQLDELQALLDYRFQNPALLELAITHRSYINEHAATEHNERIEFLGDAVLELLVTEYLYTNYPNKPEGDMTSWRSALVKGEQLANIATELGLGQYLRMSKGEARSGGREKAYLLANMFEAVLGAMYLDGGYDVPKTFVHRVLLPRLEEILATGAHVDAKSHLQELAQEKLSITPAYKVVGETGPDHAKTFEIVAYFGKDKQQTGTGANKKEAEQDAARATLEALGWK